VCPERKPQQKILWVELLKESGRRESRWRIRDFLADGRCSQSVLDFLSTTEVGRQVPAEEDAGARSPNGSSESAGTGKRRGEGRWRSWVPGEELLYLPTPSFIAPTGEDRGLNSPAGPALTSAWTGLRDAVQVSPRPAGQRAF